MEIRVEGASFDDEVVGDATTADYRRGLQIGMALSGNYIADREVNPTSVTFDNGRRVFLNKAGFLSVEYSFVHVATEGDTGK